MIDQVDSRLREWAANTLDIRTISLRPPTDDQSDRGASLYLVELISAPPLRTVQRPPLQLSLRYLVSTWAEEPEEAHRLLGGLVFAAMEHPEFEVEIEPVPAAVWMALGVIPRPSFFLRVPLRRERPQPEAKYVRKPLVVQTAPVTNLSGVVVGPEEIPLVGATVTLPALHRSTQTDEKGRFQFAAVPASHLERLSVRAKGREFEVSIQQQVAAGEPIVIHFNPFD